MIIDDKEQDDYIQEDYIQEDSALAYNTGHGLVIITGCSHAGICNITEQAKSLFKEERILDIIGGFHLLKPDETRLRKTIEYMGKIKPEKIHPCHCIDFNTKVEFAKSLDVHEVGVGYQIEYN